MSYGGLSAMPSSGQDPSEDRKESGLVGGLFSKKEHDGIHVKFSDVDWATIVRAGGLSQVEVRYAMLRKGIELHSHSKQQSISRTDSSCLLEDFSKASTLRARYIRCVASCHTRMRGAVLRQ